MLKKIIKLLKTIYSIEKRVDYIQQAIGRIETRQAQSHNAIDNCILEFKVYSQSGEDGIIQNIISKLPPNIAHNFIEFGVENYLESNTRFLALNNYWSGLIIDGNSENINFIKNDPIYWRCNIIAEHAFITKDNINNIITKSGFKGEIGLLSIDIDGNDYWIFDAINVVRPAIIIVEYNSFFGKNKNVSIPYRADFQRDKASFSKIFYGASISALVSLANKKNYALVASNSAGNNIFFVDRKYCNYINEISIDQAYKKISFREVHDLNGNLEFLSFDEACKKIENNLVINLEDNQLVKLKSLI